MLVEYVNSRPDQLKDAIDEFPLALVPHGALEWHGFHMPLGFDGLKAESLLRKVGNALDKGVIFPTRWESFDNMKFPYTLHFSKYSVRRVVKLLYNMGFRIIILLTGHYPLSQIKNVKGAAKWVMKRHDDAFALGIPEWFLLHDQGYFPGDHAAKYETSISMALFPEITDVSKLPSGYNYIDRVQYLGIMGHDPTIHASKEYGEKLVKLFVKRLVALIEQVWKQKSQEPFLEVYRTASKNFKELINLKHLDKTVDVLGMDSKKDFLSYLKWVLLKGQKMQVKD